MTPPRDPTDDHDCDGPMLIGRVLDGHGGGRPITWEHAQGWQPGVPDEVLWLHLDRTRPEVAEWLQSELAIPEPTAELLTSDSTRPRAFRDGEETEVVVAQGDDRLLAQGAQQAQHFQRLSAPIDQVAAEPQRVGGGVVAQFVEETYQFVVATLQIADGPGRHQCKVLGTDRVKGGIGASKCVPSSASIW